MKSLIKTSCVLLAAVLLFSSCGKKPQEQSANTGAPDDTTEESTSAENGKLYFRLSSLPDIGKYENNNKNEYFYDAPLNDFVPSAEYGKLGYYIKEKNQIGDTGNDFFLSFFGFITADGKIITNPVYSSIEYNEKDGKGCFFVTKTLINEKTDSTPDVENYLVSADGSKIEGPFSYTDFGNDGEIIAYLTDCSFRAYDPDLNIKADFGKPQSDSGETVDIDPIYLGKVGENYVFYNWNDSNAGKNTFSLREYDPRGNSVKNITDLSSYPFTVLGNYIVFSDGFDRYYIGDTSGGFVAELPGTNGFYDSKNDEYYFSYYGSDPVAYTDTDEESAGIAVSVYNGKMERLRTVSLQEDPYFDQSILKSTVPYGLVTKYYDIKDYQGYHSVSFYPADNGKPHIYDAAQGVIYYDTDYEDPTVMLRYSSTDKTATLIDITQNKEYESFACDGIKDISTFGEYVTVVSEDGKLITIDKTEHTIIAQTDIPAKAAEAEYFGVFFSFEGKVILWNENETEYRISYLINIYTGEICVEAPEIYYETVPNGIQLFVCHANGYRTILDEKGNVLVQTDTSKD